MAKTRQKTKREESEDTSDANSTRSRSMWSGSLSFGLVNIPIRLFPGIRAKGVRFHLLHNKDKARLQEKLVCPVDHEEVPRTEAVKGFEVAKGQHVVVSQEEIDSVAPKASRTIELLNVVDIGQIDPMFFDRPFYLLPDERATKPYLLLVEALRASKKGAIAKFVMRNKEYIGALRPIKKVLCLDTLHFADEIISVNDLGWQAPTVELKDAELHMASQLLKSLESNFDPAKLHDDYREEVMKMIQKKVEGQEIAVQPETGEEGPEVIDLMAALKKSVAEINRQKGRRVA
jgi:DNA end-binding protein Ku